MSAGCCREDCLEKRGFRRPWQTALSYRETDRISGSTDQRSRQRSEARLSVGLQVVAGDVVIDVAAVAVAVVVGCVFDWPAMDYRRRWARDKRLRGPAVCAREREHRRVI